MKQFVTSISVFLAMLVFLIAICVLSCSAKMTAFLVKKQESIVVARGIEGLDGAKKAIEKDLAERVDIASTEAFDTLTKSVYDKNINITEEEANDLYHKIILQNVKRSYGMLGGTEDDATFNLQKSLEDVVPELKTGNLDVVDSVAPVLGINEGRIELNNISVNFSFGNTYHRNIDFDVFANMSNIVLYDENPELFTYSMVADKGIYITGKTSTVIGNIYSGTHGPTELRKAEALYGESGSYGGLNIMSTQVAINADKIVTDGAVNMKGAFVVFGSEDKPVEIVADEIRETDNVANRNIYALFGSKIDRSTSIEQQMLRDAMQYFPSIEKYYDTANDKTYVGNYRKLISSTDITVSSDVTGIIMTPGSVIIEEGVNVEGLILSGDRIYVQGNNNIVSSVEVLRGIMKEELYDNIYGEDEATTDEERARNRIHLDMKDYLGGIQYRGIIE